MRAMGELILIQHQPAPTSAAMRFALLINSHRNALSKSIGAVLETLNPALIFVSKLAGPPNRTLR
jgi:hypothetical protein